MLTGDWNLAPRRSRRAIALAADLGLTDEALTAREVRGFVRCTTGDLGGMEDLRAAVEVAPQSRYWAETAHAYINLADWIWFTEGPEPALRTCRTGIDFAERRGLVDSATWAKAESLWTLFEVGAWADLLDTAERLLAWSSAHGGGHVEATALSYTALVLLHRAQTDQRAALSGRFLPLARETGEPQILLPALAADAMIEHANGATAAGVRLIAELCDAAHEDPFARATFHLPDTMRIAAAGGELELADRLLAGIDKPPPRQQLALLTARAIRAEAAGDLTRATELSRAAARRWEQYGFVLEQARSALGAGRCLLALGRDQEARAPLVAAHAQFERLGATALAAVAE